MAIGRALDRPSAVLNTPRRRLPRRRETRPRAFTGGIAPIRASRHPGVGSTQEAAACRKHRHDWSHSQQLVPEIAREMPRARSQIARNDVPLQTMPAVLRLESPLAATSAVAPILGPPKPALERPEPEAPRDKGEFWRGVPCMSHVGHPVPIERDVGSALDPPSIMFASRHRAGGCLPALQRRRLRHRHEPQGGPVLEADTGALSAGSHQLAGRSVDRDDAFSRRPATVSRKTAFEKGLVKNALTPSSRASAFALSESSALIRITGMNGTCARA